MLIEPCCAPKHVGLLIDRLGDGGTLFFHGYGDLSIAELLPALLTRYCEVKMALVLPSLPDNAAEAVAKVMRRTRAKMNGAGNMNVVSRLTIVADLSERRSPTGAAWLEENPFGERLTLRNIQQNDTAIVMPDMVIMGALNLNYGGHFTAMATKNARTIETLRGMYEGLRYGGLYEHLNTH